MTHSDSIMPWSHDTISHQAEAGRPAFLVLHCAYTEQVSARQIKQAGIASKVVVCITLPSTMRRRAGLTAARQAAPEYAQQLPDQAYWSSALGQGQLGC